MDRINYQRSKRTFRLVMQCFPITIIINARPRYDRPAIIQLPIKRSHAVWAVATVRFKAIAHPLPLQYKTDINKILKFFGNDEITFHIGTYQVIAQRTLLMGSHYFRFYLIIFGRSKSGDGLHFGERLETELALETSDFRIRRFKSFLAVPDTPVVAVTNIPRIRASPIGEIRRSMNIRASLIPLLHFGRKQFAEQFVIVAVKLLIYLGSITGLPSPIFQSFQYFVVTAPHSQASMIAQTLDIVIHLLGNAFQEYRISRINGASEHEILPYQDAVFICKVIKAIILVSASSPYTDDIHIGFFDVTEQGSITLVGHVRQ